MSRTAYITWLDFAELTKVLLNLPSSKDLKLPKDVDPGHVPMKYKITVTAKPRMEKP
jgi:hypothetical protein